MTFDLRVSLEERGTRSIEFSQDVRIPDFMEILIIDDDDDIREALREVLEAESYQTQGAVNGKQARQMLESGQTRPGLILLDLMMPVMDGWDFLAWLDDDDAFRETPVAIMSAHPSIARALEIARARKGAPILRLHGGNRVLLPKPLSFLRLLSVAEETKDLERAQRGRTHPTNQL